MMKMLMVMVMTMLLASGACVYAAENSDAGAQEAAEAAATSDAGASEMAEAAAEEDTDFYMTEITDELFERIRAKMEKKVSESPFSSERGERCAGQGI